MFYVADVTFLLGVSSTPEAFDTRTYLHQKSKPLEPFRSSGTNGTTKVQTAVLNQEPLRN